MEPLRAHLSNLAVFAFDGPDAAEWLQGQLTQDLRELRPGDSTRGLLCRPTGQLLAHLEVWMEEQGFLLLVDRAEVPALQERFDEMVVMEEVELRPLSLHVVHHIGPPDPGSVDPGAPLRRFRDRTGRGGYDVLSETMPSGALLGDAAFDALALAHGEVRPGIETNLRTLPPELGPAFEEATISYRKGCYTGQEVLMRMHSRGHANRIWLGLVSDAPLEVGANVLGEDGKSIGAVTRIARHPELGFVAGATVRIEAVRDVLTVATSEGAIPARARPFPLL